MGTRGGVNLKKVKINFPIFPESGIKLVIPSFKKNMVMVPFVAHRLLWCSKGPTHCWCDIQSLLLPCVRLSSLQADCWSLLRSKYYIFTDNTGFVSINEKIVILREQLFQDRWLLEVHEPHSVKWKFFINLLKYFKMHFKYFKTWTQDNSRLNTETGESPEILENSWWGNCPMSLLI